MRRGAIWVVWATIALLPSVATADTVGVQSRQLKKASDYKVRLSAALNLAGSNDPRAIRALVDALGSDKASTVRRVASLSLGRVRRKQSDATMRRVVSGLKRAAAGDRDAKVRRNARRSLKKIAGKGGKSLYLAVGRPSDLTKAAPRGTSKRMLATVQRALREHAPTFAQGSKSLPTGAELDQMGAEGFYIGSSVAALRVRRSGGRAEVRCSVSIRVSPWSGRDGAERLVAGKAASATGNGRVVARPGRRGISSAKQECVTAVVEQVTARQVVPFLKRTAP